MKRDITNESLALTSVKCAPDTSSNSASLALRFANDCGTTRLIERCHFGPLRVQKPLYPEGGRVCHAIIVHPPGGVVGGDELAIAIQVGDEAKAFVSNPGAAKWYKANGRISKQQVEIHIGKGASLEWMPQETIFFDAAHVQLDHAVSLATDANYVGCEILCFGRTASGEKFNSGSISQRTTIRQDGKLIWYEQGQLIGGSAVMTSVFGLASMSVCATFIAVGKNLSAQAIQAIREKMLSAGQPGSFGVSQIKSVLVARYLGNSSETARQLMLLVWQQLRPELIGIEAMTPRIWNT